LFFSLPCIDYCFVRLSFLFFWRLLCFLLIPVHASLLVLLQKAKRKKKHFPALHHNLQNKSNKTPPSLSFFSLSLSLSLSLWRHAHSDRSPGTQTPPRTHTHTNKLSHINQLEDEILHHSPPFFYFSLLIFCFLFPIFSLSCFSLSLLHLTGL